jgi:hypothetical protein
MALVDTALVGHRYAGERRAALSIAAADSTRHDVYVYPLSGVPATFLCGSSPCRIPGAVEFEWTARGHTFGLQICLYDAARRRTL